MAAITMSFDKDACRFAAAVQTNGHRVEMITDTNIRTMMIPLFQKWISKVGNKEGPQHIYYFRDGVSEGQYSHVLDQEVAGMKKALVDEFGPAAAAVSLPYSIRHFHSDATNRSSGPSPSVPSVTTSASFPRMVTIKPQIVTATLFLVL